MKAEMAPTSGETLQASTDKLAPFPERFQGDCLDIQNDSGFYSWAARPSETILCWHEMISEKLEFKQAWSWCSFAWTG